MESNAARAMLNVWQPKIDEALARQPDFTITQKGGDGTYMDRWFLTTNDSGDHYGMGQSYVYLHRYDWHDDAENPHDHPFDYASFVLHGSYVERCYRGAVDYDLEVHRAGDVIIRRAESVHRIVEVEPGTLTLFVTGQRRREWFFYGEDGTPIPHGNYQTERLVKR